MNKKEYFEALAGFKDYANSVNIYHKPIKGESCHFGAVGYVYQGEVGVFLGFTRGQLGHRKGDEDNRADFISGGLCLETKHNCSMVDVLFSRKKVDYVSYCPDYRVGDPVELVSYVMSKDNFITVLEKAGLLREKVDSKGCHHVAIQSYKNSKKKYELFLDLLDEYNEMSLTEYREMIREKGKRK